MVRRLVRGRVGETEGEAQRDGGRGGRTPTAVPATAEALEEERDFVHALRGRGSLPVESLSPTQWSRSLWLLRRVLGFGGEGEGEKPLQHFGAWQGRGEERGWQGGGACSRVEQAALS
jgi:hypothetical protein